MKIGILGGSGFIGKHLANLLAQQNEEVVIFTRSNSVSQNKNIQFIQMNIPDSTKLEGFDVLVNLVGESVIGGRWTDERKNLLRTSRVDYTKKVFEEVSKLKSKPKTFIQGSAIGYYGMFENGSIEFDETSNVGNDFLAKLCKDWENESIEFSKLNIRLAIIRTGIVLSPESGALQQMLTPFKLFAGGHLGTGEQFMSWIHIEDMISAIQFLISNEKLSGVFNFTAPTPVSNDSFSKTLGKVLHRPSIFPVPSFVIKTMFGESADVILLGQNVLPKKLLSSNFKFKYPDLENALKNLLDS